MNQRGKLIAVEGIDGSGKGTQVRRLAAELQTRGYRVMSTGFPQYSSWFGRMVGQFLNGDYGPLETVDPHFTALLYAGDRFECKHAIVDALQNGSVVLADRYIASNLAHQTARSAPDKRAEFRAWIEHLEYGIYGLPSEDLVLYLRLTPAAAQTLVAKKSAREYTDAAHDLLEADLAHLRDAADQYDELARRPNWRTIDCFDEERQLVRPPENIFSQILEAVRPVLGAEPAHLERI